MKKIFTIIAFVFVTLISLAPAAARTVLVVKGDPAVVAKKIAEIEKKEREAERVKQAAMSELVAKAIATRIAQAKSVGKLERKPTAPAAPSDVKVAQK